MCVQQSKQKERTTLLGYGESKEQGKLELLIGQRVVGGRYTMGLSGGLGTYSGMFWLIMRSMVDSG